ncbi:hypothetical protein NDN01_09600 [Sphingomonas sp. QA11]|uniref:hypothetical protein n=1 Tax=Sphingomonas sp. QA11 TaxID=2950605 RepID=UPI002349B20B|nr:hypothetical protein [Sphingomonas sp. QA11]WCM29119.1 hypothetical protein NDN01_09600 [Sphingomonas sp. QA11]
MFNGFTIFMLAVVVVGIPVVGGLLYETYRISLKHKEKMANAMNAQAAEKAAQYAAHTERLEQRVRVLERIVTDRGIDVAAEIEQLRDRPLN